MPLLILLQLLQVVLLHFLHVFQLFAVLFAGPPRDTARKRGAETAVDENGAHARRQATGSTGSPWCRWRVCELCGLQRARKTVMTQKSTAVVSPITAHEVRNGRGDNLGCSSAGFKGKARARAELKKI